MKNLLKSTIFVFLFLSFNFNLNGQCEALFTFDETDITIQFTDISTSDPGDPIVSWFWDFDDGTTSNQQNPLHTFPEPERYDVVLVITTANGCTSEFEVRIETCVFTVNITQSDCDANGNITLTITVNDVYDNADEINILVDGVIIPGSPFEIDAENPVTVNHDITGDGLSHTIDIISDDIETCSKSVEITVEDCSSDCFLSSMAVNISGGTTHTVNVGDDFFSPVSTTIEISDVINFNWVGSGHSTTSDATSGPDSWNSGVIGAGSSYDVNIINPGVHPYYCIPHGGPGGSGMSGTIIANCPAGNNFTLDISFNATQANAQGFNLYVDGVLNGGSPYNYNGTGPQSVQITLAGDGVAHIIEIEDVADPTCIISRNWTAPDCGAAPQCNLSLEAIENGACDANNDVPVEVTITAINEGASGFNITVDGIPDPGNPFSYTAGGNTTISIQVPGDGNNHTIEATDVADQACSGSVAITTSNCTIPCSITNLTVNTGTSTTHVVFVEDFVFNPANITIADGDLVEWQWTGDVDHTSTSDIETGPDSWNSGLLGTGATYLSPVLSTGIHQYYCEPHGNPGGDGMAGTITVQANCTNSQVSVSITFEETGGSFNGFDVLVDGVNAGTFNYDPSGTTSISVNVDGDGQSHTIEIVDADDATCTASTTITTPDCNASTCQLTLDAQENGACDTNDNVPVDLTVTDVGGGATGFEVFVDAVSVGTFIYDASGTTIVTIDVTGDGNSHAFEIIDLDDNTCSATAELITTNCVIPCSITNLTASSGTSTTHVVLVEDFVFNPVNITIADGDIVEWQWTGDIDHTSTSDLETGPDSWNSGLLGTGATYQSPVLSAGLHQYYCEPHGNPGGDGMAGTITVQANCTDGQVSVSITFEETGGSFNGFNVLVDGVNAGTFNYDPSGTTSISVNVDGDGQSHTIEIVDADDATCTASTTITTPDCNASTCQLTLDAQENGACDTNDNVPVDLTVTDVGGGATGFEVFVDAVSVGTFIYDASGTTVVTIDVSGDGNSHAFEIIDLDDNTCSATAELITTNCVIPCSITNLTASSGTSTTHVVSVEDFVFNPVNITIADGDIVEWQWTGDIDHTSTSDLETGPDSWNSGLLGTGATYQSPVLSAGLHQYYCEPHGNPGGDGMAGTITVQANCTDGQVSVSITFEETGGSFNGFNVLVDGINAGTFNYDPSGTTSISVNVDGDGQSHTIEIVDADDATCTASTTITTPDCNASTCQLTLDAQENGACDTNDNIPVDLTVTDVGGGAAGFEVFVDAVSVGTFIYDASGTTVVTIDVSGDGNSHAFEIIDLDDNTCSATAELITTNCVIPCSITNLTASSGTSTTHVVLVEDFVFNPVNITIADGDIVEWQWTGDIDHTSTSDLETGPDSWNSGLLGTGATYQSPVLSAGLHQYYCEPHGNPGGDGMSGTITVQANCTDGQVSVSITFEETGGSFNGFNVLVDGVNAGTFNYDPSGTTSISVNVDGDGQSHTIEIVDADDATCTASTTITTPDCNASTCQLTLDAQENGACDTNDNIPVDLTVTDVGGGATGFEVFVDAVSVGTFIYDASGTTVVTIDVSGDGNSHAFEIIDLDDNTCSATAELITTNCVIPCSITNLTASSGTSTTHVVLVEDFVFNPVNITIADGDIVEWQWTGDIDHTSTSDLETGPDSWNSGLLGTGATYQSPVLSAGLHQYYCEPHGNPGGDGMSGTITVQANCTDGQVSVSITFEETGGSFNGFNVLVDGVNAGTFNYDPSGTTSISVNVDGDGQSHTIEIVDADDATCTASTTITTPDCNASTCQLTLDAQENGACDTNDNIPVDLTVTDVGGGATGFEVFVDAVSVGTFIYDASGTTVVTIDVSGDGNSHAFEIIDLDDNTCSATAELITTNCVIPCSITNLTASSGTSTTHVVLVEDFVFNPVNITIADGDIVEWQWTGDIDHTSTSDLETGPDSWNSGLLGTGATYQSPVLSAGLHQYYCEPHGNPGGDGMSGTITVQANCTDGQVSVSITFEETGGSFNGFNVLVDGVNAGTFNYDPSGTTSISVNVDGDGQSHTIEIVDTDDATCTASTTITTPDCNASTCQLTLDAQENGACDTNDNVPVDLTVTDVGGGAAGFEVFADAVSVGTFAYDASGTTVVTIDVAGDGNNHTFEIIDLDDNTCSATAELITTNCVIPCSITNLNASSGTSTTHVVFVEDFVFNPVNITIADGDIVEWQWTGDIDHTSTSDLETGPDSWNSGLLGTGATYQSPVLSAGLHQYYCEPHGNPGGDGMSGTITVQANCTDGQVSVSITFEETGGSFNGFDVLVDGVNAGTFNYDPSGTTSISVNVDGDGQSHTIEIVDADDATCTATTTITTPDCNASTCQLTLDAEENGSCDTNDNVPVDLTVTDVGGGAAGFEVFADAVSVGTFAYDASGTTVVTIDLAGDGNNHTFEIIDLDDNTCSATAELITTNCVIPCSITNLNASSGTSTTHVVFVEDFVFNPVNITIADGDIVEWQWTGDIDHTSTSDLETGPDSWNSGLLGTGATYQSPVLSAGLHQYYCEPHGNPGGDGMAGTITVQANCTDGQVSVSITFEETGGSFNGFDVLVDGVNAGTFNYDPSGTTSISVNVDGDGQSHTIEIVDADDATCTASTTITTPDCNASTCQLTLDAEENGSCDTNDNVPVDLTVTDVGGGAAGFEVFVDAVSVGTFAYDASGTTVVTIDVAGDGNNHTFEIIDLDDNTCSATAELITTNCVIPCSITNLNASSGTSTTHVVFVEDFVFNPVNITIADGDIVKWQWTGDIDHTSTSDLETGPDSWNSGLLGTGATYQSPVLSAGLHQYYCEPHGNPGGDGMSGTITVQANCTDGQVSVSITFEETGGSFNGFNVLVDGVNVGTFNYDPSGTTSISVNVDGDGQSHTIEIVDTDDATCTASTTITTPDCNASTCQLTLDAQENGACDTNDNIPVDLTVTDVGGGAAGFEVFVDAVSVGTFAYDASGTTVVSIDVSGDGNSHAFEIIDLDDNTCSATAELITTNCVIPCSITNLTASSGTSTTHVVLVEDFVFNPVNITIADGDIVEWQWTGDIDHTSTSDLETGPDSWNSGLLGTGATYQSPVLSAGLHQYYCEPHGNPGGDGMAGTITVQANCTDGQVSVSITFEETGGSFNGFNVLVDGINAGTFNYDPSGTTSISVNVDGDGLSHTIEIVDADDATCTATTTITTPDCNASTCQLTLDAQENGTCDTNDNVPVDLTVTDVGGGAAGFEVFVDAVSVGTFAYDASGTTVVSIDVSGDGNSHAFEIIDLDDNTCSATAELITTNCVIPCSITNLTASSGTSTTHVVLVEDFVFNPVNITIADGDIVEWQWTGDIDHTSTSDLETGPDSWNSGLLGTGATYQSPVLSAGLHQYYCEPHGNPGGDGMAGTITVQANCTDGQVSVSITFEEIGGSFNGFNVLVDGVNAGTFNYDPSGTTSISVNVDGDGQSHTIEIVDADDATCTASTTITTPDCNASTCQLTLDAQENGACDTNDNIPVDLTVTDVGGGAAGFEVFVDAVSVGTFIYDASGTTIVTIDVTGDGNSHAFEIIDLDDNTCSATAELITTNCVIPCSITNLTASSGTSTTHVVSVEDFVFNPVNITISDGDIVEWQWTGDIDHTSTSDLETGPDSWNSGLLGTGATYQSPVLSAGLHQYYCEPHGNPGGDGMSGTITVQANCTDGQVSVSITFEEIGGSFNGFNVLVDGINAGTFNYDPSGTTSISVNVDGDGQSHTIEIVDTDDATCTASTTITTPDCNASTCQLTLDAQENGACDTNDNVPVDLTVTDVGGGAAGFEVFVDAVSVGTFAYDASGTTVVSIDVFGDGNSHAFEIIDLDDNTCSATAELITTNCLAECILSDLTLNDVTSGNPATHTVQVADYDFIPRDITVNVGDQIHFDWTGQIAHTSTSVIETGPDSWNSELLNQGATFDVSIQNEGLHPYYCEPHGLPDGTGMAGTITAVPPCNNGEVSVEINFVEANGGFEGFNLYIDNILHLNSPFDYHPSGINNLIISMEGDGALHAILIEDIGDNNCTIEGNIQVSDCASNDPCSLSLEANQNGDCDSNNLVPIDLSIIAENTGTSFNVLVDGNLYPGSPFNYNASNPTDLNIMVTGTGANRTIEIQDVDSTNCIASVDVLSPLCGPVCEITNLQVSENKRHFIEVKDYEFLPDSINVLQGDTIEFFWTGVILHTTTSDATSGPDSWASPYLGQGATFEIIIQEAGLHPYYCEPHGGPGGIGMAGVINAFEKCNEGIATMNLSFETTNGSSLGYNVFLDGFFLTGPIPYDDPIGFNSTLINLPGDASPHLITVQDLEIEFCAVTTSFETPFCDVLCEIQNLEAITGENLVQVIEVKDYEFEPLEVTLRTGEAVRFVWTGDIPHTATSDALTGPDAWDSGYLGLGGEFGQIINSEGDHPYYCEPHGGPGGIGMAGMIHALPNCENGEVAVEVNFSVTSGSPNGYNIFVDGTPIPQNPIAYTDPTGMNTYLISVPGDGQIHLITVQDVDVPFCAATTQVEVIDCSATCDISNASIELTPPVAHIVEVTDFEFLPRDISINIGDTVRYIWTGVIDHTTTSDATTGDDVWDSGLLGEGAIYDLILTSEGFHPYYCTPHGEPEGIGMAGTITVINGNCQNGLVNTDISFNSAAGSPEGYNIFIDDILDASGPYFYDPSGMNTFTVSLPGDGTNHTVLIQDAEDENCEQALEIITPNCSTDCNLIGNIELDGTCDTVGLIPYEVLLLSQNVGTAFHLLLDGNAINGSPFTYSNNDSTFVSIFIPGDGMNHLLEITDVDSLDCTWSVEVTTEECIPDCIIELSATQTSTCDNNGNVTYDIIIDVENPGNNGFHLFLDDFPVNGSPFDYDGSSTLINIEISGDGLSHEILVFDLGGLLCSDTINLISPDCSQSCLLTDLSIDIDVPGVHIVEVKDYDFEPKDITIELGDTVRWVWTGEIPHSSTSDTISGEDTWNSGLLGQGAVFEYVIQNTGFHPYYCVPHGTPNGGGMAGTITVIDPCDDDSLNVNFIFMSQNNGLSGYTVSIDGSSLPENPFDYSGNGTNTFSTTVIADGQTHDLLIQDLDDPDCNVETTFEMPDCNDPCLGFEAVFIQDIDHSNLEAQFFCQSPDVIAWSWDFGNGETDNIQNPVQTYAEEGTYEVCVEIENAEGCTASVCDSISIGVYQCQAIFDFENEGLTVNFIDQSITSDSITNWIWDFGNGFSQQGIQNPVFTYDTLGIYEVCLTIETGSCTSDTCVTIDLSDPCLEFLIDFAFTIDEENNSVQFIDLTEGNPNQWLWGFGDANTSNEQNPEHFYDEPGAYNVCLLVQDTDLGCNSSYCQIVYVNTTSTSEPDRNLPLTVFPNPVESQNIQWTISGIHENDYNRKLPLKIYDVSGKTILEKTITGSEQVNLQLERALARSIYFIEIKGENGVYRAKVIVQ